MFVLKQSTSYVWPVEVKFPVDGGKYQKQTFDGEFQRVSQSEIAEIRRKIQEQEITDPDLARQVLIGWKGVHDDKGDDVPFSTTSRDILMDMPLVAGAVVQAFFDSLEGARRKN